MQNCAKKFKSPFWGFDPINPLKYGPACLSEGVYNIYDTCVDAEQVSMLVLKLRAVVPV